ncbi:MAG: nucleotidyltransferase family protein [Bdellovibrionales bacterium]
MSFGLSESQYHILKKKLLEPLWQKDVIIYAFGSRARGTHHPFSDIDILLVNSDNLPAGFLSELKEKLEDSKLEVKVDIVEEEYLAESYKNNVNAEKIEIHPMEI